MAKNTNSIGFFLAISLIGMLVSHSNQETLPCALKEYSTGLVCVCNSKYCDYLDDPTPSEEYVFAVVSSSKSGLRFATTHGQFNLYKKYYIFDYDQLIARSMEAPAAESIEIEVDREQRWQKTQGFIGSISDSIENILKMFPRTLRKHIYQSFFTQHGINVDFIRVLGLGVSEKYLEDSDPIFGSWERGEKFAQTLLKHLNTDSNKTKPINCNILLDYEGGDAPMIANTTNHLEVYKQPLFYTMGHFTKFIAGGSVRIAAENKNDNVDVVAFLRADESVAVIILNRNPVSVDVGIQDTYRGAVLFKIPPHSIHTVLYI
ncbi:lysosomal acid glucosylceramidase-like [Bactrocera neohumeralis]|uniref:lysosomal acid glucosylceramidase-like n=1 Tax=Bactrocera neohumeralis TaxID=98809 RepID=UPI0021660825|nr:lysosomal acid glucosylceramidase-like [Bactrocera neohumeralis]XP_050327159.1 lysosomal acid glucosylceramidase-like [Bactrocera neohumeralis]XP_050327169.1 lysosomal acid glucosylceramidase-like [Bactrocera neohumeralis]XP_050327177.1 lysosomal acid glucosylceramidase-like [Bactrocera neohumeralis]XP_050327185.1 lysosomal acid glucosylceramidase-like [Bactrocera neohumeralis]XP_050327195.1 lysosomal acid glucosylceramidase-like [Bactrocera neohumeralis]